ncbi:MAG: hypothetical protein OWQ48_01100 [Desulfurococcus sp.]|nr:hypothetical protein [Desulfurococcus sp.]
MRGGSSPVILVTLLLALTTGIVLLTVIPSSKPYSIYNTGGNGYSKLASLENTRWVSSLLQLSGVDAEGSILIVSRMRALTEGEVSELQAYAARGGIVLAYGSREMLASLIEHLGLNIVLGGSVYDPIFNAGDKSLVLANSTLCKATLVLPEPAVFEVARESRVEVAAWSSPLSYVDSNGNSFYDLDEPIQPSPLGVRIPVGEGSIIVFSTPWLLANSVLEYNTGFLNCISAGRYIVIDESEVFRDPVEYLRSMLRGSSFSPLYVVAMVVILALILYYLYER